MPVPSAAEAFDPQSTALSATSRKRNTVTGCMYLVARRSWRERDRRADRGLVCAVPAPRPFGIALSRAQRCAAHGAQPVHLPIRVLYRRGRPIPRGESSPRNCCASICRITVTGPRGWSWTCGALHHPHRGRGFAMALHLAGLSPRWDDGSDRVSGFDILPLAVAEPPAQLT